MLLSKCLSSCIIFHTSFCFGGNYSIFNRKYQLSKKEFLPFSFWAWFNTSSRLIQNMLSSDNFEDFSLVREKSRIKTACSAESFAPCSREIVLHGAAPNLRLTWLLDVIYFERVSLNNFFETKPSHNDPKLVIHNSSCSYKKQGSINRILIVNIYAPHLFSNYRNSEWVDMGGDKGLAYCSETFCSCRHRFGSWRSACWFLGIAWRDKIRLTNEQTT